VLADFRRQAIDQLITARRINYRQELAVWKPTSHAFPQTTLTYLGNVMNTRAASFYQEHGVQQVGGIIRKRSSGRCGTDVLQTLFALQYGLVSYPSTGPFAL